MSKETFVETVISDKTYRIEYKASRRKLDWTNPQILKVGNKTLYEFIKNVIFTQDLKRDGNKVHPIPCNDISIKDWYTRVTIAYVYFNSGNSTYNFTEYFQWLLGFTYWFEFMFKPIYEDMISAMSHEQLIEYITDKWIEFR